MNISAFFASLGAALLARLSSVGAALAAGFATIVMSFTGDQRAILLDVKQKFNDSYHARLAKGQSTVDAIEGAATDAFNQFCGDEQKEFAQEAGATITLLESAAKQAAGIVGTVLTTQVTSIVPAAAGLVGQEVDAAEKLVGDAVDKVGEETTKLVDPPAQ